MAPGFTPYRRVSHGRSVAVDERQLRCVKPANDPRPARLVVKAGERWLVLGANGSGKTTLLRIAGLYEHPSSGEVDVLGERLGRTDVRVLRRRVGYLSAALAGQFRPPLRCLDVVMTARYAVLEPWWHRYTTADEARDRMPPPDGRRLARRALAGHRLVGGTAEALLARTLMNEPGIVLLDEPSARLSPRRP